MTDIAEPQAVYLANEAPPISDGPPQLAEPDNAGRRVVGRPFVKGSVPNPYGRKGNPEKRTAISELRRKADKKASQLADALIKSALNGNTRAWIAMRDTAYGVPATKLVIEQADSGGTSLLMELMAARGLTVPAPQLPEHNDASTQIIDQPPPIDATDT